MEAGGALSSEGAAWRRRRGLKGLASPGLPTAEWVSTPLRGLPPPTGASGARDTREDRTAGNLAPGCASRKVGRRSGACSPPEPHVGSTAAPARGSNLPGEERPARQPAHAPPSRTNQ